MAFTKKTLSDCLQSLADRLTNGKVPSDTNTLSFWKRTLNRGVQYCADRIKISKSTSLTTVNGTIAFPDDFIVVNNVFDSGNTEYVLTDPEDSNHEGTVYWVTGNQTDGFSLNTPTDEAFTVKYSFRPDDMVNNSDVCVIPDIEAVVAYAYSKIRKSQSDPFEDAAETMQECDARLAEATSAYSINTDAIGFTTL